MITFLRMPKMVETGVFNSHNRPFAVGHSCCTNPPCWRAKDALRKDKQRKLLF